MTKKDREEFKQYCATLTDSQLDGVVEKEMRADRDDYAEIARTERAVRMARQGQL